MRKIILDYGYAIVSALAIFIYIGVITQIKNIRYGLLFSLIWLILYYWLLKIIANYKLRNRVKDGNKKS